MLPPMRLGNTQIHAQFRRTLGEFSPVFRERFSNSGVAKEIICGYGTRLKGDGNTDLKQKGIGPVHGGG